jgi:hypothetical protein
MPKKQKKPTALETYKEKLIEASKSDDFIEACKEWSFLYKDEDAMRDNHCLCSEKLIHQYYYINTNTCKIIVSGGGHKKLIDSYIVKKIDPRYMNTVNDIIIDKEFVGDYDLEEYCKRNKERMINKFKMEIKYLLTIDSLLEYSKYLNEYWFEMLEIDEILDEIDGKIELITREETRIREAKERDEVNRMQREVEMKHRKAERQKVEEKMKVETIKYNNCCSNKFNNDYCESCFNYYSLVTIYKDCVHCNYTGIYDGEQCMMCG